MKPSVRVLDHFLEGCQNGSVGYQFTHRPATLDAVSGPLRVFGEPLDCNLMWFCSEFSKAFKKRPAVDAFLKFTVNVQWDPVRAQPAYMIPSTQTIGGQSTPVKFARFPAWNSCALAALAALPVELCVDDMIGSERMQTIRNEWTLWRLFADLCGWRVLDAKSPRPAHV